MSSISDKLAATQTFLTEMPSNDITSFILLVVAGLCLHEWAFIHYAAGILTVYNSWTNNVGAAMGGIASAGGDYTTFNPYPKDTNRVYIQHGINLFIAGLFADLAVIGLMFNFELAPYLALLPFLVDVGYFIAIDLPHLGGVIGQAQTYIVSVGLICSAVFRLMNSPKNGTEHTEWAIA